jgi:hypothetical protein
MGYDPTDYFDWKHNQNGTKTPNQVYADMVLNITIAAIGQLEK